MKTGLAALPLVWITFNLLVHTIAAPTDNTTCTHCMKFFDGIIATQILAVSG